MRVSLQVTRALQGPEGSSAEAEGFQGEGHDSYNNREGRAGITCRVGSERGIGLQSTITARICEAVASRTNASHPGRMIRLQRSSMPSTNAY